MVINMENNKRVQEQEQKEKSGLFNEQSGFSTAMVMHIVLIAAIVIIFIVCAYKLYKWNKGVPSDYDPNFVSTDFDVETLDSIIPLAPDKLKGHEDDGLTTILFLGNDPLSMPKGQDNGLAEMIAANAPNPDTIKIYNGSFTGSTVSAAYEGYNDGYWMDSFTFPRHVSL